MGGSNPVIDAQSQVAELRSVTHCHLNQREDTRQEEGKHDRKEDSKRANENKRGEKEQDEIKRQRTNQVSKDTKRDVGVLKKTKKEE